MTNGGAGYVAKFNPNQSGAASLVYSSYVSYSFEEEVMGVAADANGNAYLTGYTDSKDFYTTSNALERSKGSGSYNAFIMKVNPNGSQILYSTYLGGNTEDGGSSIALDSSGNIYVAGTTGSPDFPTKAPLQAPGGGDGDAFVTELNAADILVSSTFLGGGAMDYAAHIAVDNASNIYVVGATSSTNFPVVSAAQSSSAGGWDAFVTKITSYTVAVTNTNDSGAGSLRQAIANTNAAGGGTITFAIPTSDPGYNSSTGVWTIKPSYVGGGVSLPVISSPTILDGWSQGGPTYNGAPLIDINGVNATDGTLGSFGFNIQANNVQVRGFAINNFPNVNGDGFGIGVFGSAAKNDWIYGNDIGTDSTGTTAQPNGQGASGWGRVPPTF